MVIMTDSDEDGDGGNGHVVTHLLTTKQHKHKKHFDSHGGDDGVPVTPTQQLQQYSDQH